MSSFFSRETLLRWLLALGCFAAVIFFFSPSWGAFTLWSRVPEMSGMLEVRRGAAVLAQAAHPGAEVSDPLHRVIQWRLLFPVLGYAFGLPPTVLFGLAHVGCVAVLGFVITLLRRKGLAWPDVALGAIALGAASWVFVSTGWLGYYDSWLALGLLVVAFGRSRWTVWAACVWAPWIDERFVIATPVALLCRWLYQTRATATSTADTSGPRFSPKLELAIPGALLAGFLILRLGLLSASSAANATVSGYFAGKNYLDAPLGRILLGVWNGLRGGWVFVVAAVYLLRRDPTRAAVAAISAIVMIVAGLATAQDYSRSMTMLLPLAVAGLLCLGETSGPARRMLLGVTAAAALLLPAHHVMNDRVNPIYYLYHELAALESPPPAAMPELHELRAIHAMERGEYAEAEAALTLAMKLAPQQASAAKQRGVLYASAHRWEDARRDFSTVVENDPDNPDGWFLRAQVELALRDVEAARSDFEHAKSIASPDWTNRPDVTRFSATFAQQAGKR